MNDYKLKCEKAVPWIGKFPRECVPECRNDWDGYTQEQLQEMVMKEKGWGIYSLTKSFQNYLKAKENIYGVYPFRSFKEAWLRFVMWVLRGKKWSDEEKDWV